MNSTRWVTFVWYNLLQSEEIYHQMKSTKKMKKLAETILCKIKKKNISKFPHLSATRCFIALISSSTTEFRSSICKVTMTENQIPTYFHTMKKKF